MTPIMVEIDLQNDEDIVNVPDPSLFQKWVEASLQQSYVRLEQSIRIVDEDESRTLNRDYRSQDKPTNVLSFPAEASEYLDYDNLGDLVICAKVVEQEAEQQSKSLLAHWAHMVVHGMLHLQGFDHLNDEQAEKMESLEIEILATLGQTNPYSSNNP
jgi:probable rRNA maturation factor